MSPSNATDNAVTWVSSDDSVATVSSTGAVRGVKAGMAVIMATAGGKSGSIIVTVNEVGPVLQSVAIAGEGVSNNQLTLAQYKTAQLSAKATPANASLGVVYWSSSDTSVATVDGNGKVTAKGPGFAAITVSAGDKASTIVVSVSAVQGDVVSFRVSADVAAGERLYVVGEWGQGGNPWADVERNGVLLSASGDAYVGSLSVRDGQSMKLRLVKRTASGAWRWDPAGDRVFTARSGATYGLSWSSKQVQQVAAVSFRVSADVAAGERLYVVGEWGGAATRGRTWSATVCCCRLPGDAYVGSLSVRDGQSMKLRLVKRTASGAWR